MHLGTGRLYKAITIDSYKIASLQEAGTSYDDQQDEQYQNDTSACVQSSNCRHADSSHLFVLTDQQDHLQ
jgi:hypothetical protein